MKASSVHQKRPGLQVAMGGPSRSQLPWHFVFSPYDSEADTTQVATERLEANVNAH